MEREEGTREEDTGLSIRRGWFNKAADAGAEGAAASTASAECRECSEYSECRVQRV